MSSFKTCYKCGRVISYNSKCECESQSTLENKIKKKNRDEYLEKYNKENEEFIKPLKTQRWRRFREQIIQRDGGFCQRCKVKFDLLVYDNLEVHHIKPRVKFPELIFEESNCITVCSLCNNELGTSEELDFEPDPHTKEDIEYIL